MKTLKKLVYSILEEVSNWEITDDNPISLPWIEDQIISQNHSLIREAYNNRRIDEYLYQLDEKLEIKQMDKSFVIGDIPISNKTNFCYVDIKTPLTGLRGKEIEVVTYIGYTVSFLRTSIRRLLRKSSGYYSLDKPKYAVYGDRLLFRRDSVKGMKYISISAIWTDPRVVSSWDPDKSFPTPSEKKLELLTIQHIAQAGGFPMDLINDGQRAYQQPKQNESS
jgi:hypothetical protein